MGTNQCNAIIRFGDDFGDNVTTFHCQLENGHEGKHKETGNMGYSENDIPYILEWDGCSDNKEDIECDEVNE